MAGIQSATQAFHLIVRRSWTLLLLVGCDAGRLPARPHAAAEVLPPPLPRAPATVAARSSTRALPVPGYGDAVVVVPDGEGPRAVVVAAHANYDRPEYQCALWRAFVEGRAFVLCPRGVPQPSMSSRDEPRFTYPSQAALNREIAASLAALRAAYGARVLRGSIVYAGFSLGAILAGGYVTTTSERIAATVLVEGGHTFWSDRVTRAFAAQGGRAVVFACGQASCARDAGEARTRLRAEGVASEVAYAPGAGHEFQGRVAGALRPVFERLVTPTFAGDRAAR